jgi:hypothetical protein
MRSLIDGLKFWCCCLVVSIAIYYFQIMPVLAVPTPIAKPIELKVSLGNTANELKFFPDRMQLVAGKGDGLFINISGIGILEHPLKVAPS